MFSPCYYNTIPSPTIILDVCFDGGGRVKILDHVDVSTIINISERSDVNLQGRSLARRCDLVWLTVPEDYTLENLVVKHRAPVVLVTDQLHSSVVTRYHHLRHRNIPVYLWRA